MTNLKFLHIPKTAGTSIENEAKNHGILWGRFDKSLKRICKSNAWHCPQDTGNPTFCVIRNPYDRFISEFRHLNDIKNYNSEFLNTWVPKILETVKKNPNYNDNHFISQTEFVKYCTDILLFDDLNNELDKLTNKYKLPKLKLNHHFGGYEQDIKRKNKNYNRLTIEDLSIDNLKLLKDFFKEDFILYDKIKTEWEKLQKR